MGWWFQFRQRQQSRGRLAQENFQILIKIDHAAYRVFACKYENPQASTSILTCEISIQMDSLTKMKYSTGLLLPRRSGKVEIIWVNLGENRFLPSIVSITGELSVVSTIINFEKKWNRFQPFHLWKHLAKSTGGSRIRYSGRV